MLHNARWPSKSANPEMASHESVPASRRRFQSGTAEARPLPRHLTRKDLQTHLGISEKAADRFIRTHALKSGTGGHVLVVLEAYAACLAGLRRRSTRDGACVPLTVTDHTFLPPIEYAPGLDVCAVLCFEAREGERPSRRMKFLLQERDKAPPSSPEEFRRMTLHTEDFIKDSWACSIVQKILTATGMTLALDAAAPPAACADASDAARHVRTCLEWYQSTRGRIGAAGLGRLAREARGEQRVALFAALAHSVGESARHGAHAPLDYALNPLLDEGALAKRLRREPPTLKRWRVRGEGPVFMRIGKLVRYSTIDVDAWTHHSANR